MGGRGARSWFKAAEGVSYSIRAPNKLEPASLNETPALGAPEDVTDEYRQAATPGVGAVTIEAGVNRKASKREIAVANWLYATFGGEITVKKDADKKGILTPDYLWNGKLWDLKTVSTEKAVDSAMRHGLHQIAPNPGGVILDYRSKTINASEVLRIVHNRISHRSWGGDIDVLILTDERYSVFRYK